MSTQERCGEDSPASDRERIFRKRGAFWDSLVFGSVLMLVPTLGQVMILGPLAAVLFAGLRKAVASSRHPTDAIDRAARYAAGLTE